MRDELGGSDDSDGVIPVAGATESADLTLTVPGSAVSPDSSPSSTPVRKARRARRLPRNPLTEFPEFLQVCMIFFSAVSLAQLEFFKHAFPRLDMVLPDKSGVVWAIMLVIVAPTIVLIGIDRLLAARWPDGRWNRWFRAAVFAAALMLILRQGEEYSGRGTDLANSVRATSKLLMVALSVGTASGLIALCVFAQRGVVTFFYYMSPIAVAMVAIIPYQLPTSPGLPDGYLNEVTSATNAEARDPVFVLIFDEMSYDQITDETGMLDAELFPNMAALADEGLWLTNATSNYFWSNKSIPYVVEPLTDINEEYNVRLYSQYTDVEKTYQAGCGKTWTCRGTAYLTDQRKGFVAANVGLRTFNNASPGVVDDVIAAPMGVVVNSLGIPYPEKDPSGFHVFTKKIFDTFLGDINSGRSMDSAYFAHVFMPHHPFAFDAEGNATRDVVGPVIQSQFADKMVGEFVAKLREEGLYERSTIIVTSDHGYRGKFPTANYDLQHHTAQVPMIIHGPGIEAAVSDVDYQHIDFAATLNDILDLPAPKGTDGVSVFATQRPERDKIFYVNEMVFRYDDGTGTWVQVTGAVAGADGPPALIE